MRLAKLIRAAVVAALLPVVPIAWIARGMHVPADPTAQERPFTIRSGEPLNQVVRRLDQEQLLPRRLGFGPRVVALYARLHGMDRSVKAGEYELSASLSPSEILEKISTGAVSTYAVTLPEGLNVWEIAERIEQTGIASRSAILELALSKKFAAEVGLEADSLEGYLYPETYRFAKGTDPKSALRTMVQQFQDRWTAEDRALLARSGRTMHQLVSLASIVEKETGNPTERPRIAAVFLNRLSRGMRLQSDPTVIYGILRKTGSFSGNLRRVDLEADDPYNTYKRGGIPPGPIASVSMDAVRAVLSPERANFLYFVSRNDGTHQFSNTLVEHNKAVTRYQKAGAQGPLSSGRVTHGYSAEAKRPGSGG